MMFHFLPRLFNKVESVAFEKYVKRYCKYTGNDIHVGFNWAITHPECISIGNNFSAKDNLRLECWCDYRGEPTDYCRINKLEPELTIGDNVSMVSNCQISCVNKVFIGEGCLFGDNVFITDNFHGVCSSIGELNVSPIERKLSSKGPVVIGKNCWLGRNVCIMSGVTIGDGCVIGANAVVTHDIPAYTIAGGIPAKVIREVAK